MVKGEEGGRGWLRVVCLKLNWGEKEGGYRIGVVLEGVSTTSNVILKEEVATKQE